MACFVSTPFLLAVTSAAFSKCFGAFIIATKGFNMKILKKKKFKFPKKLVSSNFFSVATTNILSYGVTKFFGVKIFFL